MQSVLVCDVGFGYTKFIKANIQNNIAVVEKQNFFPSIVKRLLFTSYFKIKDHPDYVEIDSGDMKKSYLVGYSAIDSEKIIRTRDSAFFLDLFPILLQRAIKECEDNNIDLLVIGTPFQEWSRLKDNFIKIAEPFANQVECFPQAAAASIMLNEKAFNSIVVDIGYNTTDVVPVDGKGRVLSDKGFSWAKSGMSLLLEDFENVLKNSFGFLFNQFQIEELLIKPTKITKIAPLYKNYKDSIKEIRQQVIREYVYLLDQKLLDRFTKDKLIVLAGGGAKIVKPFLAEKGWKIFVLPDPQFANAKGFLKLGLATVKFSGSIKWLEKDIKNSKSQKDINKQNKKEENIQQKQLPMIQEKEKEMENTEKEMEKILKQNQEEQTKENLYEKNNG